METRVVVMDEAGRLTVSDDARRELGLSGATTFELDVDAAGGALVLRTAGAHHDDVTFTPEQLESLARGMKDSREGRTRRVTEEDLLRLGGLTDTDA
jgi:bifunctional DNA-binding transcriptional regulator/antitoxin component of YhaV-PrlF toxin-antitoxin module